MSERDPFDNLRDLIDEPVAPRAAFADDLRSRLMREMSASDASREEQAASMESVIAPRPPVAFPTESVRRIRPMVILELAAVAVIILGLVAALNRGWFQNDPDPSTAVPAAILQNDSESTPETAPEPTSTPLPTVVPERTEQVANAEPNGTMEPTVVPPGNFPNTVWAIPAPDGESIDFGGMLIDDDTVYRLLATPSFVGIQAVDTDSGSIKWQQTHRWAGHLFAIEDDVLYFDGGGNTLTAVNAETGAELWRAPIAGDPRAITDEDDRVFVLLGNDMVTALDAKTGDELWVAQGAAPQNASGGSASDSVSHLIAVEGNTVAAIATNGVLSGFDVATGEERWSHEGYEAATSSINTEDDRFIVIDAVGIWVDGEEIDPAVMQPGTPEAGVQAAAGGVSSVSDCAGVFVESGSVTSGQSGAASVESGAVTSDTFRVQAIDPATGEILWERESMPNTVSASSGAVVAAAPATVCAIEAESGQVVSISAGDDDGVETFEIGSISGGTFVAGEFDDDLGVISIAIGSADQSADNPVIFAVGEDDSAYLQLMDGTLVKVSVDQMDDDDHLEDHDDSDDHDDDNGSPESESDDD
jgi:outer membrane protein assembly factor BamB